jgi:hypothetical protein
LSLNLLTRDHKRELVLALHAEGAFKGKSASNYVANVLGHGAGNGLQALEGTEGLKPAAAIKCESGLARARQLSH